MLLTSRTVLNTCGRRTSPTIQENAPCPIPRPPGRLRSLAGGAPCARWRSSRSGRSLSGSSSAVCTAVEYTTDYIGDLFSYVEDDDEIFGDNAIPGGDEPYRSLSEVPAEAPAMSSTEERAALTAGLVADRENAQHTAETLRARVDPEEPMTQVRTVYQPAEEATEPAPANGG